MLLLFGQLWQGKTALTVLLLVSSYSSVALAAYMSLNCSDNFSSCAGLEFFFFFLFGSSHSHVNARDIRWVISVHRGMSIS